MVDEGRHHETRFSDQLWEWRDTAMDKMLGIFPRTTAEHLVNAQKEGILAIRSLLDRGIEALERDLKRVNERPSSDR